MKPLHFVCVFTMFITTIAFAKPKPVPLPLLNQPLVPASAAPGSKGFTLTINGAGFESDAVVNWNGSPRATSVLSSTSVQAIINAADVAKAGTASVTVTNAAKRNRISNVVFFPIRSESSKLAFSIDHRLNNSGAIAVGDFNNDGKLDVAVGNGSSINVYLGKGDGTFRNPIQSSVTFTPDFIVAGDVNNDGKLDLLASYGDGDGVLVAVLLGNGAGKLTQGASYGPSNDYGGPLAVGDLNGDGNLDFLVSGESTGGAGTSAYLGNGDGTFRLGGGTAGDGFPAVGDFNGDGILDAAAPDGFADSYVDVCLGNGDGTFHDCNSYNTGIPVYAVAAADVNGDGKLDLITDGVVVLLNNGDGTFSQGSTVGLGSLGTNAPIGVGDFNGDGKLDVVVLAQISSSQQSLVVLLGRGDGKFGNPIQIGAGSSGLFDGLGVGDFDGTGELGAAAGGNQALLFLQSLASISPRHLSFGNHHVGSSSKPQADTLTNIGSSALPIAKIEIAGANSKDFSQTNNCPSMLPGGQSCRIKVTFKPTQLGQRLASLKVSYTGAGSPATVPLRGTGVSSPKVTLAPSKLSFSTRLIGTSSGAKTATLTNTGDSDINISNISTTGPFKQTNNCPGSLQPGSSCQIHVQFDPRTRGILNGKLSVDDNVSGSPQTVALSGTGTVVQFSSEGANFGDQKVGTKSSPIPITLTNKGKASLSISQITTTGKDAGDFRQTNNCGSSVPAGGSCTIEVTFAPTAKGKRSAELSVSDDGGGSPQGVPLTGTGT
jgi:FG-GAP-like repeat/Abnormal spindle-like microcephaly-assoc'd, ASPM-SPD-2-Hydin